MPDDLTWRSGVDLASMIRSRAVSSTEVVDAVLDQLDRTEPWLNAFVSVTAELARESARAADDLTMTMDAQSLPPLHGVPISVKDLCDTAGVRTTYGSVDFADHVPTTDSIAWSRLKAAGPVLIGKTTTPEFGMLGVTESQLTGRTNNPWDPTLTSGGSSGGAAASVAAGVGPFAWGSDGGGSVRVPAACCGVVGLKASRGRIPVDRPWESVSTDGPLTRTVADAALLLAVSAGPHGRDPLALPDTREDFAAAGRGDSLAGVRVGYSPDWGTAIVDPEVLDVVVAAMTQLVHAGALVEDAEIVLPDPVEYFKAFWTPAFAAELGEQLLQGGGNGRVHPVMVEMARRGLAMSAVEYYRTATATRGEISRAFADAFDRFDILVSPTMPVPAFPHPGEAAGNTTVAGVPVAEPAFDFHRMTEPPSHAGHPAITVPCGFTAQGVPVGMQIVGPMFADAAVLRFAAAFEEQTEWHLHRPHRAL